VTVIEKKLVKDEQKVTLEKSVDGIQKFAKV